VLRRHRRRGVGREAAALLFDRFRGPWEIRQRAENPLATLFWRRAVAAYTGGGYDEAPWADAKGAGVVQRLSSAP
jgi:predicted acetyltransferase